MPITADQAATIAKLARLRLDEDKLETFAGQMDAILAYMETLGKVDTTDVEPLYSPVEHTTVTRTDTVVKTCTRDAVLQNAPATDGQFFVVPKIV